jgi:hypothetical protein
LEPTFWQQTKVAKTFSLFRLRQMPARSILGFLQKKQKNRYLENYIYVLVNLQPNKSGETIEYFVVPSKVISEKMIYSKSRNSEWWAINLKDVEKYREKWSIFGISLFKEG